MDLPVSIVALLRDARAVLPTDATVAGRIDAVLTAVAADKRSIKERVLDRAADYVDGRANMADIAKDLGVSASTVWSYLNMLGFAGPGMRLPPTPELVLMLREGERAKLVARKYCVSLPTVYAALRRDGLRLRGGRVFHDVSSLKGPKEARRAHVTEIERRVRELKEARAAAFRDEEAA